MRSDTEAREIDKVQNYIKKIEKDYKKLESDMVRKDIKNYVLEKELKKQLAINNPQQTFKEKDELLGEIIDITLKTINENNLGSDNLNSESEAFLEKHERNRKRQSIRNFMMEQREIILKGLKFDHKYELDEDEKFVLEATTKWILDGIHKQKINK